MKLHIYGLLLSILFISIKLEAQYTLVGHSHYHNFYAMGNWNTDWDSTGYSYSNEITHYLDHNNPEEFSPSPYFMQPAINFISKSKYLKNFTNEDEIVTSSERFYEDEKLVQETKCYYGDCKYKSLYSYENDRLIHEHSYKWNLDLEEWDKKSSIYYQYNIDNLLEEKIYQRYDDLITVAITLDSFYYSMGNRTCEKQYSGESFSNLTLKKNIKSYFTDTHLDSMLYFNKTKLIRKEILFNGQDQLDSMYVYLEEGNTGVLYEIPIRYDYLYNDNNNLIQVKISPTWYSGFQVFNFQYHDIDFVSTFDYYTEYPGETDEYGEVRFYYEDAIINTTSYLYSAGKAFQIFPNPSSDFIQIPPEIKMNVVQIFNNTGAKVYEAHHKSTNQIDVSSLKTGHYHIIISSEDSLYSSHFIKH